MSVIFLNIKFSRDFQWIIELHTKRLALHPQSFCRHYSEKSHITPISSRLFTRVQHVMLFEILRHILRHFFSANTSFSTSMKIFGIKCCKKFMVVKYFLGEHNGP
ncbi:CLUMA_CG000698, isoform A [Clunio marinus]|uniref:CLUMA_CG000698, isoform A n=1 Tax=Clunio marinus TaxID=568069 RepID=A0A1J1HKW0_9DIPT|nr:CLUMA_CG000698, isoform A [Clunio marinus]